MTENNVLQTDFVKKQFIIEDVKVNDRCHITGKYTGTAHNECKLNPNLTKTTSLLCFIICKILFTSYSSRTWSI